VRVKQADARRNGAGHIIGATATIGDGFQTTPSSSRGRFAAGVGIVHRF